MGGEEDRLSALCDDILRRILYFTPAKEAASTSVLSRRWGSLWRSTSAVNLAVHIPDDGSHNYHNYDIQRRQELEVAFFSHRDAFVRGAEAALAAATVRLSRLTIHMEADHWNVFYSFLHRTKDPEVRCDVIGGLFSHPAACRLEELRLTVHDPSDKFYIGSEMYPSQGAYALGALPSPETLRVLHLTRCRELRLPEPVAFPRLAKLQLQSCVMDATNLQSLIDAAPELTTVHLEFIIFSSFRDDAFLQHHTAKTEVAVPVRRLHLRCLAATTLVLALCTLEVRSSRVDSWDIEIEAPRLRSFRYKGRARRFLLRAPAPEIVHVDLHFLHDDNKDNDHQSVDTTRRVFWQLVHNFSNAKIVKIKVKHLEHIAAIGKAKRTEHLCLLPNVERLELEGVHDPESKKAAVAIANFLRCCPALRDLQLKLSTVASESEDTRYVQSVVERQDRLDYEKSVDHFMRRRLSKPTVSLNDQYDEVSDIPGLRGRSFTCLQTSLRRVGLQFRLDMSNCFGARLIRFFAENAMVLEEIAVDCSTRRLMEHMNLDIERWIAPDSSKASLKCKNIAESSWEFYRCPKGTSDSATDLKTSTSSFTVIPLQRLTRMECWS